MGFINLSHQFSMCGRSQRHIRTHPLSLDFSIQNPLLFFQELFESVWWIAA